MRLYRNKSKIQKNDKNQTKSIQTKRKALEGNNTKSTNMRQQLTKTQM